MPAGPVASRKRSTRRLFFVRAGLALLAFEVLFGLWIADGPVLRACLQLDARLSASLLGCFGFHATAQGSTVLCGASAVGVQRGCDGLHPCGLLAAAVLAFPATWGRRARLLVPATVGLLALNVVRVASLSLCAGAAPRAFEVLHEAVWPAAFVLVPAALFAWWSAAGAQGGGA